MKSIVFALLLISSQIIAQNFYYNQLGFISKGKKHILIDKTDLYEFSVISVTKHKKVYSGTIVPSKYWNSAGAAYALLDFSEITEPGEYYVSVLDYGRSDNFVIGLMPYHDVLKASVKAFYFNRAGCEITKEFGGEYARAAGHPDTKVMIHSSAADKNRKEGTIVSSPKGWYDAGDYNKYIVNSGISMYELLLSYDHFNTLFDTLNLNIPESGNDQADLLDEIKWNLDWMMTMQDPNDGGVYHKLSTENFSGHVRTDEATAQRYMIKKSTAAALDLAAVLAYVSRLKLYGQNPIYMKAAGRAMAWSKENPQMKFKNPETVKTGEYGDTNLGDEWNWANTEMRLALGKGKAVKVDNCGVPSWNSVGTLAVISELSKEGNSKSKDAFMKEIDKIQTTYESSVFKVSMGHNNGDFNWGSNSSATNQGIMLIQAYRITKDKKYLYAAQGLLDYVLGKNPTGYCYVTGFGTKSPMNIHHRPSISDDIEAPVPGFIAGGPQNGKQDRCVGYPSNYPAKCYLDAVCSYSTNEIAINWNAPLVYLLAAIEFYSVSGAF